MSDVNEIADELRRLPYGHRAYEAADEIERLQARVRELEAAVREYLQAEGSSGDLGIRDDRYVVRQRLLTAVSAEEKKEKQ